MKRLNKSGFTLIELLAVIVIMGILMMVAIPAMTRYIENSRKDTFVNTAKNYANAVKNMWASDSLKCGSVVASANPAGLYYVEIDSETNANNLLESGGTSSWGNANVKGYVLIKIEDKTVGSTTTAKTTYSIALVDGSGHGIDEFVVSDKLGRGDVKPKGAKAATAIELPDGGGAVTAGATKCVEQ